MDDFTLCRCHTESDEVQQNQLQLVQSALQSIQKVSTYEGTFKWHLRLIGYVKKAVWEYTHSNRGTSGNIQKYLTDLNSLNKEDLELVMRFFKSADPREMLRKILQSEGACSNAVAQQPRKHRPDMAWIPQESKRIAEGQRSQKHQHGKKKKSRRGGKGQTRDAQYKDQNHQPHKFSFNAKTAHARPECQSQSTPKNGAIPKTGRRQAFEQGRNTYSKPQSESQLTPNDGVGPKEGSMRTSRQVCSTPLQPVDVKKDEATLHELRRIGGNFLVVCKKCFEDRQMKVSHPDPTNPNYCSFNKHHIMKHNKCLVHRLGPDRCITKMRERPFKFLHALPSVCWYVDKPCGRRDSCHFAHSEAEAKLWWLEAKLKKKRPEILEACIELNRIVCQKAVPSRKFQRNPEETPQASRDIRHENGNVVRPTRTVEVDPCHKVPFIYTIKLACERCWISNPRQIKEQNPERPSYCTGSSRHSWGSHTTVYVVYSSDLKKWIRVHSRHKRLFPNIRLMECRKGKQCKVKALCMFPHSREELELWEYQKLNNLPMLEDVMQLQQEARVASVSLPKQATQHMCVFCNVSCFSQRALEDHLLTVAHKATILSDSDRVWKERNPPNLVQNGTYEMCTENATKQCDYSGRSREENECIYAHSLAELQEWKQRFDHRLMKFTKARQMNLHSWLDHLVHLHEGDEDVITEEIFGMVMECDKEEEVRVELPEAGMEITQTKDLIQWRVVLHCGEEKQLKRVGLLYDDHRPYFFLSKPVNEYRPQTCPGGYLKDKDSDAYAVTINFLPVYSGCFKQWLIFDFGESLFLVKKLIVMIGSESEIRHSEVKEQTLKFDLWNESNSEIIEYTCMPKDQWIQRLEEKYPTPGSDTEPPLPGDMQSLTQENYKEFMHRMLTDEERARMEMVAKYRTVTNMTVSKFIELGDSSLQQAQGGELYGTIQFDKPLHDDSEASSLVQQSVDMVYLKFQESDVVYEARKVEYEKNAVKVLIGSQCVRQWQLKDDQNVLITIQCCINRRKFLSMHHAVDSLSCMDTVLPREQQPNRFPKVADEDCREDLNSRQEQAVRHINSVGKGGEEEGIFFSGPTMILGPFGTGKTYTLAKAIQRALMERKDTRFLICTRSNSAADLYIEDFLHEFCESRPDVWMVRVYATMRKLSTISNAVRHYTLKDEVGPRLPTEKECQEWVSNKGPNIVVTTLTTAEAVTRTATLRGFFTHIVLDEAGQTIEPEAIIPLALATEDTNVILAGDPRQISPKVYSTSTLEANFNISLLERLYKYNKRNNCQASCNLTINYRSCQPILDFLKVHYGTAFKSKSPSKEHPNLYPLNFVDVRGEEKSEGTSFMNTEEARKIVAHVASLMLNWPIEEWGEPKASEVVVLSPYRVQVKLIRQEMKKHDLGAVKVTTVQDVQGKQYRAVFLSTVRTRSLLNKVKTTSLPQAGSRNVRNKHWYGFLSDKGLLNTAFTRAQSLITVMGDPVALCSTGECQMTWQRYIKTCQKNHGIYSDEYLTMASIQNEIASKKRLLNPRAKVFIPSATVRSSVSRAIEVESCSQQKRSKYYLPASSAEDDEDEELLDDDWLRELMIQAMEDEAEDYSRLNPDMSVEGQGEEDEAVAATTQEDQGAADQEDEGQDIAFNESQQQIPQRKRQLFRARAKVSLTELASKSSKLVHKSILMVQRDGRPSLRYAQNDTYDSGDDDDDNEENMDASGQAQQDHVQELIRKANQTPDVYKICIFSQDITGRTYAIPEDRQSGDEIMITSMKRRGQALNRDKVLVEVLEYQEEQQSEEDFAGREVKTYGKVVGIIERNANLRLQNTVCYLDPQTDNIMVPVDRSRPRMLILGRKRRSSTKNNAVVVTLFNITNRSDMTDKRITPERDIEVNLSERRKKLFVVRYLKWLPKHPHPLGVAVEELEPGNTQEKGLNILKLIYCIKSECKPSAMQEMRQEYPEGWSLPDETVQKRADLRDTTIFTIDPPGSTDLDDAISCVNLPGQRYQVGVHIADVSYFIPQDGSMDKDAFARGTTFYHPFPADAYHMLPKELVVRFLSLVAGEDRLALSVIFTLDDRGQIVEEPNFTRSLIRSCQRLTYEDAEALIIDISNTPGEYRTVAEPIRCLHMLSRQRRMERLRDEGMVYNTADDDGGALSHPLAHSLIEELMLMTNNAVAEHILTCFPYCTPLRRQLPPSQDQVEAWKKRHDKTARNSVRLSEFLNLNQNKPTPADQDVDQFEDPNEDYEDRDEQQDENDVLVAAEVWHKIRKLHESKHLSKSEEEKMISLILQDGNHPQLAVALTDSFRIMEHAEYVDSKSQPDTEKQEHYSLQMRAYTHFTSPIRRYIDLVVHRMLVACIENSQCPYTPSEMADITHHCNNQNVKSKLFDTATKELKLALKLKEAPLQATTFVAGFSDALLRLHVPHRSYISSRQTVLSFRLLKPSEKPDVDSSGVKMVWRYRMYDNKGKCPANSPASHRVAYPERYFKIPEDIWQQIIESIRILDANPEGFRKSIAAALSHARPNDNPFSGTYRRGRPDGRPDQNETGVMSFGRSYRMGDPCRIQMHSQVQKGILTPKVQLLNMVPNLDTCVEHREQPIECFSRTATEIPGREKTITDYKSKWLQILSMTSCHGAVSNDDTVILQNVKLTLEKSLHGITGHFELDCEFLRNSHLDIIYKTKKGKLKNNYEYLCICFNDLDVDTTPQLIIKSYDERGHEPKIGPFNDGDWKQQSFIIHCRIENGQDCPKCKSVMKNETNKTLPVHFVVHQYSGRFPEVILDGKVNVATTVEFISNPVSDRRQQEAVEAIDKAPVLVRDVALQRPNHPDLHSDYTLRNLMKEAKKIADLRVPGAGLNPLNDSQQAAVKKALNDTFSVIQGPPGTGKTVTGAHLAYFFTRLNQQLIKSDKRPQVLYCGPSNKSVDVVAGYLRKFKEISIVRVYSEEIVRKEYPIPGVPGLVSKWTKKEASMPEGMADLALHRLIRRRGKKYAGQLAELECKFQSNPSEATSRNIKKYKSTVLEATKTELQNHHIVLCTCSGAGAFRIKNFTRIIQVIVDEAGMCSEPETLIPLVAVKPHQVVLVGDQQQLRSIITEPNARELGMDVSLLEKYKKKAKMLTIQYRMHKGICEYPSKAFYKGELTTAESVNQRDPDPIRSMWPNNGATPRVFCHVYGQEETLTVKAEEANEMSKSNRAEIAHVIRIVKEMIHRGAAPEKIMILSQYRLQCAQIEERLREDGDARLQEIKVSTVVKSQGSEWDYVVFSTVRSKPRIEIEERPSKGWQRKHLGFINDENQMNVALTRARQGLVIIGNQYLLRCHNIWKDMLKMYEASHCLLEAHDFPTALHH